MAASMQWLNVSIDSLLCQAFIFPSFFDSWLGHHCQTCACCNKVNNFFFEIMLALSIHCTGTIKHDTHSLVATFALAVAWVSGRWCQQRCGCRPVQWQGTYTAMPFFTHGLKLFECWTPAIRFFFHLLVLPVPTVFWPLWCRCCGS